MIQKGSFLNVIDNSGGKVVCCIQVSNGYRKRYAKIGDLIVVSVKSLRLQKRIFVKLKKGDVCKAVVIRTKTNCRINNFEILNFSENEVILLNKQNKFIGTRILGTIPKIFRHSRFLKIFSLASNIVK
jgi:large subunit ribosomal protein L14